MQKFIFDLIVISFYLMLPIYFANMAPVIVKKINFLKYPIDLGIKFNKKPIFGKNKTFRGLFFGVIFAIIVAFIQFLLFQDPAFQRISLFDWGFS
jgi:CDP-diglyceride synthetase